MFKILTTKLSKNLKSSMDDIFERLLSLGLIERKDNILSLTISGKIHGSEYSETHENLKYIIWPKSLKIPEKLKDLITSKMIGNHFDISPKKMNYVLSELGLLKPGLQRWLITEQGLKQNGWHMGICTTGVPFVRSKAEMIIDNWLYMVEIVHSYEKKLPIEELLFCDFYIPTGKVYIEYWEYEDDGKYLERKKNKIELYNKYEINLIELYDKDVKNLDDILPKLLLKYGIKTY